MAEVIRGRGALAAALPSLIGTECVILGGQTSFRASGAAAVLEPLIEAGARALTVQGPLPVTEEVDRLVGEIGDAPLMMLAVGGGLVIDVMKVVGLSLATGMSAGEIVDGTQPLRGDLPQMVAVPTTAGSGAERTPFAVLYQAGVKHSIDDGRLLPVRAILDPTLGRSVPKSVAAAAALDAMSHCVESIWACRSTPESQALAAAALERISSNIEAGVVVGDEQASEALLFAASDAGEAIAQTRTTAAHALSYHLTSEYGIAHGHAVALTLGLLASFNEAVDEASLTDPRGVGQVRSSVAAACRSVGVPDATRLTVRLTELMRNLGLAAEVDEAAGQRVDRQRWVSAVNAERLANNPRRLTEADLSRLVEAA